MWGELDPKKEMGYIIRHDSIGKLIYDFLVAFHGGRLIIPNISNGLVAFII
jgi:hypothetical protein